MGISEFLKERSNRTGYVEEKDPDVVELDFNIMKQDYEQGVQRGESTGIREMDENLSWMRGHQNCWTGWANDGKTTFLTYMMIIKSLKDGWKWCIWSPEMKKANFVDGQVKTHFNVIAYEMMATISGKTPYRHVHEKFKVPLMSLDEIHELTNWIGKHFTFLDPQQRDIKYVIEMHRRIFEKQGFDGFLLDPYKNIKAEIGKRDDQHLSDVFAQISEASIATNSVFNWIAHPRSGVTRTIEVDGVLQVAPCNQSMLSGGAAWDNSMDGIYTPLRPYTTEDLTDNRVRFYNLKQRMQDLTAQRGHVDGITYDVKKRRYIFENRDPLMDLIVKNGTFELVEDLQPTEEFDVWSQSTDWEDQF